MGDQQYDVVWHRPGHWALQRHGERRGVHVMDHIGNFEYDEATDTFTWPAEGTGEDSAEEYEDDDEE